MSGAESISQNFSAEYYESLKRGDYYGASQILEQQLKTLESENFDLWLDGTAANIHLLVKQSRYEDALRYAKNLESHLGTGKLANTLAVGVGYVFSWIFTYLPLSFSKNLSALFRRLRIKRSAFKYDHYFGLLFGFCWQNINKAVHLSLYCFGSAQTDKELLKGAGFLGYFLAVKGHAAVGIPSLKRAIRIADEKNWTDVKLELRVFLGIAYQFSAMPIECKQSHAEMEKEFPSLPPFVKIIGSASYLNVSFTDQTPKHAQEALNEAYRIAVSMKDSRNHIQIYGVNACLKALEGQAVESLSLLVRARTTAEANANTLDHLIYYRFESIVHLLLKDFDKAARSLDSAFHYLRTYGQVDWYHQEFLRVQNLIRIWNTSKPLLPLSIASGFTRMMIFSLSTFNRVKIRKGFRLAFRLILEPYSFWTHQEQADYLKHKVSFSSDEHKLAIQKLEEFSKNAHEALSIALNQNSNDIFSIERFLSTLGATFGDENIVYAADRKSFLAKAQEEKIGENWTLMNSKEQTMILPTRGGGALVAIDCSFLTVFQETFVIGVKVASGSLVGLGFLEQTLRFLVVNHLFQTKQHNAEKKLHEASARAQLAEVAMQVSHDIRSPLAALQVFTSDLSAVDEDIRNGVSKAVQRIKDIANNLLNENRRLGISRLVTTQKLSENFSRPLLLVSLLEQIIAEKRINLSSSVKFHLVIQPEAYSRFVFARKSDLGRVFSNILDNAIEALDETSGTINIQLNDSSSDYLEIIISDSGSGFPREVIERFGEPGLTIGKKTGNGLGLFHAKKFIEEIGGRIVLNNSDSGARVSLSLKAAPLPKWYMPKLDLREREKVVIVDDDQSIHEVWNHRFRLSLMNSLEVHHCRNEKDLNKLLSANVVDSKTLFLVDHDFGPHAKSGINLIEEYSLAQRAILVTSKFEDEQIQDRCLSLGLKVIPKNYASVLEIDA